MAILFCPNCKSQFQGPGIACAYCGHRLNEGRDSQQTASGHSTSRADVNRSLVELMQHWKLWYRIALSGDGVWWVAAVFAIGCVILTILGWWRPVIVIGIVVAGGLSLLTAAFVAITTIQEGVRTDNWQAALSVLRLRILIGSVLVGAACLLLIQFGQLSKPRTATASGIQDSQVESILQVLKSDNAFLQPVRSVPADALPSHTAQKIAEYCSRGEAIDLSKCPPDFRVAYRHHLSAWREMEGAVRQIPDGLVNGFVVGAINVFLRQETDAGIHRLEGNLKTAQERIRSTWHEVEAIGAKYGAAL